MANLAKANCGTRKDLTKNLSLATVSLEFSFELLMDSLSATPVTSPRSSLLQSSVVFKLPYHLLQRCLHCSANCPGTRPSRWDHPSTLCSVDICAAFPSHSPFHLRPVYICAAFLLSPPPFHQVNIHHGYHHANLCIGAYKHPHHK